MDPAVPVPDWALSPLGRARAEAALARPWARGLAAVWSSAERKARDAAQILCGPLGLAVRVHAGLGENDRSATGYLPPDEFQRAADLFFANPRDSVRGWERAVDAQARVAAAARDALARSPPDGDVALVAHGGVGALLLCHLLGEPISRRFDQPPGGGGFRFAFDRGTLRPLGGWTRMED